MAAIPRARIILAAVLIGLLPAIGMVTPPSVSAAELSICSYAGLTEAIETAEPGETITFACPAGTVIEFDNEIMIDNALTIDGALGGDAWITFDGQHSTRFFSIQGAGDLTLSHLTLQNGRAEENSGGAIYNLDAKLTLTETSFIGNSSAYHAGAIYSNPVATLMITSSSFTGNSSAADGGAILSRGYLDIFQSSFMNNQSESGGAISVVGPTTIAESSFIANQADFGGAINNGASLTITQSSFSGNQAAYRGGAIFHWEGDLNMTASTMEANMAPEGSALYVFENWEKITSISWSTIVQPEETGPALRVGELITLEGVIIDSPDVSCIIAEPEGATNDSYTIATDASCQLDLAAGSQIVDDTGLSAEPTSDEEINEVKQIYYMPSEDSPAINTGGTNCSTPDQIGTERPVGGFCDIGAIESSYLPLKLCANRWNGSLRWPADACSDSETQIAIPSDSAPIICANAWNGDARYSPSGICNGNETRHEARGDNSIPVCVNRWNGSIRVSAVCSASERGEVI